MSSLAVLKSSDPLFASLFSALLLAESIFNTRFLIALVLILIAIVLGNFKVQKKTPVLVTEQASDQEEKKENDAL